MGPIKNIVISDPTFLSPYHDFFLQHSPGFFFLLREFQLMTNILTPM